MKYKKVVIAVTFLLQIISGLIFTSCAGTPQISSQWRTNDIVVDGKNDDWKNVPVFSYKKNKFNVSMCNDGEFEYICLTSQSPHLQRQMVELGFTVWFDPDGGSDKVFGINFPTGRQSDSPPPRMDGEKMIDPEAMQTMIEQSLFELAILGPEETDRYLLPVTKAEGIQVKMERSEHGMMVYELRVPLKKSSDHPYAIEATQDKNIGVGFETGELKFDMAQKPPRGEGNNPEGMGGASPPPMGQGGRGIGEPPPGRGRRGEGKPSSSGEKMESVKVWYNLPLAKIE
jgi:hypothetical protein